jgi:hypothetical protein
MMGFQPGMVPQVQEVGFGAGKIIIQAENLVILAQQMIHQMGADEPGPAGDQNPGHVISPWARRRGSIVTGFRP